MPKIDLTGQRFGLWTVVREFGRHKKIITWLVTCDCGTTRVVLGHNLKSGESTSCGCRSLAKTHNKSKTREYKIWKSMIRRVESKKSISYKNYGGRGIIVCPTWRKDFQYFYDDMGPAPYNTSIDRIDNNGNYEPGNCRWATRSEQARNYRQNHCITYLGETHPVVVWAEKLNITNCDVLYRRLYKGWSVEKVFTTPIRQRKKTQKIL